MLKWTEFINSPKSIVLAPAGHGKTHAIAECVEELETVASKPILILTHTHAGVASIRSKLKALGVSREVYQVETISSFAQRYALAFLIDILELPSQEDNSYFTIIQTKAKELLANPSVILVVQRSYSHLFVDEYQDCTVLQHEIIMNLSSVLPTHIFGDPLQSIFNFGREPIVDFNKHLSGVATFNILDVPWRWRVNNNCEALGYKILEIRQSLLSSGRVSICSDTTANIKVDIRTDESTDYSSGGYFSAIQTFIKSFATNSTLIVVPSYIDDRHRLHGAINERIKLQSRIDFRNEFTLIEAIDDNSYYSVANSIDNLISDITRARKKVSKIKDIIDGFDFKATDVDPWFNGDIVSKRQGENKIPSLKLDALVSSFIDNPSLQGIKFIIAFFSIERHYKSKRPDKLHALMKCIDEAINSGDTVRQCMYQYKNRIRKNGRKIEGKCIGTTLLTKGLEFDNVIVLDAHRFADKQNFYVAISRACKNLVIISKSQNLQF